MNAPASCHKYSRMPPSAKEGTRDSDNRTASDSIAAAKASSVGLRDNVNGLFMIITVGGPSAFQSLPPSPANCLLSFVAADVRLRSWGLV